MTAWILVRNETIKTTRRLAFWVAVLAYSGIVGLMLASSHMNSVRAKDPRPFLLPDAWWNIIEEPAPLAAFFGAAILVLLIASESRGAPPGRTSSTGSAASSGFSASCCCCRWSLRCSS